MITVTENAVKHLRALLDERDHGLSSGDREGLRLFVERGGCAGMQYAMKIGAPEAGDLAVDADGVPVFIAADSADLLRDVEVDYSDSLTDAGFKINNPNAARSCGCGTSFEPTAGENTDAPGGAGAAGPVPATADSSQPDDGSDCSGRATGP